ncbi:MAG: hypothetical protein CMQ20_10850 [Gammaproteobacteria bacterium]|jgi:hypothetical protein|nr:hypothetical protein [Gammaproteobacteria bacterium]|tara:strand:+ start:165 stop:383 length:219 start_codon:yes stop_codon:yes gene_type:complete
MDSYSSEPIVNDTDMPLSINIGDVITKQDWVHLLSGTQRHIDLRVKVEDVRHLFWDAEEYMHSVSIRVVPVE